MNEPHFNGGAYYAGNLRIGGHITSEFYSFNGARISPDGNDATGVVGDSEKPFRTLQGAFDAFDALGLPGLFSWIGHE